MMLHAPTAHAQQINCTMQPLRSGPNPNTTDIAEANFTRLNDCIRELTERVDQLQRVITTMRGNLLRSASETVPIDSRIIKCPEGSYLVAMSFEDQAGLAHGALWGPKAVCSKLNVGAN
jgi:hypothetical protein